MTIYNIVKAIMGVFRSILIKIKARWIKVKYHICYFCRCTKARMINFYNLRIKKRNMTFKPYPQNNVVDVIAKNNEEQRQSDAPYMDLELQTLSAYSIEGFPVVDDDYDKTLLINNIIVISRIKSGDKLFYYDKTLTINTSYGFTRWMYGQSRYYSIAAIINIFKVYEIRKTELNIFINTDIIVACINGLNCLKMTYSDDNIALQQLNQLIDYVGTNLV